MHACFYACGATLRTPHCLMMHLRMGMSTDVSCGHLTYPHIHVLTAAPVPPMMHLKPMLSATPARDPAHHACLLCPACLLLSMSHKYTMEVRTTHLFVLLCQLLIRDVQLELYIIVRRKLQAAQCSVHTQLKKRTVNKRDRSCRSIRDAYACNPFRQ